VNRRFIRRLSVACVAAATLAGVPAAQAARIYTVAGTGTAGYRGDGGPATAARLNLPRGVSAMPGGGFTFAEANNNLVRAVSPRGIIATLAGTGAKGFGGDGGPGNRALLNFSHGVGVLPSRAVVVADTLNNRIRRIAPDGTITTVAGTGASGYGGDGGPATAARISAPRGVAAQPDGGFLVADSDNRRIRRVDPGGAISTVAGTGVAGSSGDGGPAVAAQLGRPFAVAALPDGGLLIADAFANRVRRVLPNGTIQTVAGNGGRGYGGDRGPATAATLAAPHSVAPTADGGFLIAEPTNFRVRQVSPAGIITTLAGNGRRGSTGDGGSPGRARIDEPKGVATIPDGGVLIAEAAGNRVRFIAPPHSRTLAVALRGERFTARGGRLAFRYAATVRSRLRLDVLRGRRALARTRARRRAGAGTLRTGRRLPRGRYTLRLTARASGGRVATDSAQLTVR
jgi:hypothetical protein